MKKVLSILFVATAMVSSYGCKKCSDCPSGYYLAVDEPGDDTCICCPDGTTYSGGACQ